MCVWSHAAPRLREIEERLHGLKTSSITQTPALKFKVRQEIRFSSSSYFLNIWTWCHENVVKWRLRRDWLYTVCLDTCSKEQHGRGGSPPGVWPHTALSSVQSSSALEKWLSFCLQGFKRMNSCSLARFTFGQVQRENKSKERKSWDRCVAFTI